MIEIARRSLHGSFHSSLWLITTLLRWWMLQGTCHSLLWLITNYVHKGYCKVCANLPYDWQLSDIAWLMLHARCCKGHFILYQADNEWYCKGVFRDSASIYSCKFPKKYKNQNCSCANHKLYFPLQIVKKEDAQRLVRLHFVLVVFIKCHKVNRCLIFQMKRLR